MKTTEKPESERMDRRSMVRSGTALLDAGLVGSFAVPPVGTSGKFLNDILNIRVHVK